MSAKFITVQIFRWVFILGVCEMKPLKIKVSITLDDDIVYKIKRLSEQDDRSFSQYINIVLKKHVAKMESKN